MRKNHYIFAALVMCLVANMYASENGGCKLKVRAEDNGLLSLNGKPPGPAIIFSDAVTIPSFRLRFVDEKTGSLLKPGEVSIAYGWRWLQYPYPEHSWGAWSYASDLVSCVEPVADEIIVPQFEVKPRGWYNGRYTRFPFSKKPSFSGISVTTALPGCSPKATIKPGDARGLQGRTAVVKVDCYGESRVTYEK